MNLLRVLVFCAGLFCGFVGHAAEPIAQTAAGKVRGVALNGVVVFKGVPYGGDTAKRRFQAPVEPEPWTDVRDCTAFGPIAPQPAGTASNAFHHADLPQSEDCLNLNLWTPALRDGHKRPVFVYFHGGGFDSQSGDLIDGAALARRGDAVVIAVNHRLGGFGYLFLGDLGGADFASSGNAGQLDLILSLRWVQANVAEFGGDPGCVTIFGESGGAGKCAMLMAAPAARGLFHRVWTLSGALVQGIPRAQATGVTRAVLAALNLKPDQIEELQTLPREKLVAAFARRAFAPVTDGTVLPRDPFQPDATPLSADIPLVLGTTHDEMSSFLIKNPQFANITTWEETSAALRPTDQTKTGPHSAEIIATYRKLYPDYSPKEVAFAAVTVMSLWRSIVLESDRRAEQSSPTWVYCLNWPGRGKAAHAIDTALILADPAENWRTAAESTAPAIASLMSDAFLAFGRTGNPNVKGQPEWPRFTLPQRPTMIFDLPPHLENDPRSGERELFLPETGKRAKTSGD